MQIYRWQSATLENYLKGDILAIGTDVEDARNRARQRFSEVATRKMFIWGDDPLDEDAIKERDALIARLEQDIQGEPEIADAFFIEGGE